MEKVTVYAGWFYCNERRAYYRWEEFINYEWEKDAHISEHEKSLRKRETAGTGETNAQVHFFRRKHRYIRGPRD
jgi:hypothetical protein|tara:strand:- start:384 stop:605 length:222 start_codon:yes stop_codon:yes gene_type:complete